MNIEEIKEQLKDIKEFLEASKAAIDSNEFDLEVIEGSIIKLERMYRNTYLKMETN